MPPQQGKRLLDLIDGSFGFCAHVQSKPIAGSYRWAKSGGKEQAD
jgi:hypothetical protein